VLVYQTIAQTKEQKDDNESIAIEVVCFDITNANKGTRLFALPTVHENHGIGALPDFSIVASAGWIRWADGKITSYPLNLAEHEQVNCIAVLLVGKTVYVATGTNEGIIRVVNANTNQLATVFFSPTRAEIVGISSVPGTNRVAFVDDIGNVSVLELNAF